MRGGGEKPFGLLAFFPPLPVWPREGRKGQLLAQVIKGVKRERVVHFLLTYPSIFNHGIKINSISPQVKIQNRCHRLPSFLEGMFLGDGTQTIQSASLSTTRNDSAPSQFTRTRE